MVDSAEGEVAVRWARTVITRAVPGPPNRGIDDPSETETLSPLFDEPRGAFVTLKRHPDGELRGCIGFPLPVYPLRTAIRLAAVAAALEDPRFPPLPYRELYATRIEVSILSVPVPIRVTDPAELASAIEVGLDGLIAETDGTSGLLLPQVAMEQGWDARTFLSETCVKAGLAPNAWLRREVRFRKFRADVFGEETPNGDVVARAGG